MTAPDGRHLAFPFRVGDDGRTAQVESPESHVRDELIQLIGFNQYARIWDGVAVAERLLARAWSMYTDGHPDEAAQELPLARTALDNAVEAMRGD